jgi:hypothetical protein
VSRRAMPRHRRMRGSSRTYQALPAQPRYPECRTQRCGRLTLSPGGAKGTHRRYIAVSNQERPCYFAALFAFAQRFLCAAAIRSRASGLSGARFPVAISTLGATSDASVRFAAQRFRCAAAIRFLAEALTFRLVGTEAGIVPSVGASRLGRPGTLTPRRVRISVIFSSSLASSTSYPRRAAAKISSSAIIFGGSYQARVTSARNRTLRHPFFTVASIGRRRKPAPRRVQGTDQHRNPDQSVSALPDSKMTSGLLATPRLVFFR